MHKQTTVVPTCVLAEGALDVGRGVPHIGLSKGCHKVLCQLHLCLPSRRGPFVLTAASRGGPFGLTAASGALFGGPLLQELGGNPLVVTADEVVGVVDGGAVHGEPADGACAWVMQEEEGQTARRRRRKSDCRSRSDCKKKKIGRPLAMLLTHKVSSEAKGATLLWHVKRDMLLLAITKSLVVLMLMQWIWEFRLDTRQWRCLTIMALAQQWGTNATKFEQWHC